MDQLVSRASMAGPLGSQVRRSNQTGFAPPIEIAHQALATVTVACR